MIKESKAVSTSLILLAVFATFYVLVVGKAFLVPLAIAIMIWYVINALSRTFVKIIPQVHAPNFITTFASLVTIGLFLYFTVNMVQSNIDDVSAAIPLYKENFSRVSQVLIDKFGLSKLPNIHELTSSIKIAPLISKLAGSFTSMISNVFLVLIYVLFLILEQGTFQNKITTLFPNNKERQSFLNILSHTQNDIQTYLWIKTLTSLTTGIISYIVLLLVGVDFAIFWAFTIFLLNFIPTVGSIIATFFPAVLALIQFETYHQCLIVLVCVGLVQVAVGNFLEPKLMGNTLNLSPFIVMLSLTLWGSIWGVAGMFLSVPITVIMLIVFAHFKKTRFLAILLSGDGNIKPVEHID